MNIFTHYLPFELVVFYVMAFGLCLGSLLNVIIHRMPNDEGIVFSRSRCPSCHYQIPFYFNIPVIGYLILHGRCANCKSKISPRYIIVELLTMFLVLFSFYIFGASINFLFVVSFVCILIASTFIDLQHMIIPDKLTIPGIIIGIAGSFFAGSDMWIQSVIGVLVGGGSLFFIAYLYERFTGKDGLGGGDIKLLACIGAFLGAQGVLITVIISSISGSLIGGIYMLIKKQGKDTAIPFGPFLALGALCSLFFGREIWTWYFNIPLN